MMSKKFPSQQDYIPPEAENLDNPSPEQLQEVLSKLPQLMELVASDTSSELDNRDAVRMLLRLRNVSEDLSDRLVEPYDNGFYKKSDGKSTPLSFLRVPRFLRIFGFQKDVVSVILLFRLI